MKTQSNLDVLKIIFNWLLNFIITRQDLLLLKIGLYLKLKKANTQCSITHKGTKLWMRFLQKSYASFVNRLKQQFLQSNQL